ncbi:hypothetical protein CHU98_g11573 [Xylaria longipes]|nr:hypothetical protein CHU98_g11573 [Xylaria longipes]
MSLALSLPIELIYYISKYLDDFADLSSWSRSCRAFYAALTPLLYYNVKDDSLVMCWACDKGHLNTVQRLLDAGANPNAAYAQKEPRWWNHLPSQLQPDEDFTPSLQPEEDHPLSRPLEEPPSRHSQHEMDFKFRMNLWLQSRAAIDHEMIEYFEEDFYDVDGAAELDLVEEDDIEIGWFYHWNPYKSVKTFPQRCYWTPLHVAAARGNDKLVNLLLDNGADINALSRLYCTCATPPDHRVAPLWTPLHTSMCHRHESTTRLLLSRGASANVTTRYRGQDDRRFTALHSACTVDLLDAARALVDGGYQTDVTVRDHKNLTPLAYAFFRGNWAMIDFLLAHGADVNATIGPLNALGHACLLGYYAEALRLLDLGATLQCKSDIYHEPPIYFHLIAVAELPTFHHLAHPNKRNSGLSLTDVVKALLHSGADVRDSSAHDDVNYGSCALDKAISLNSEESQKTPKGAMLNTIEALLEAMAQTSAPRLVEIDEVGPDNNESDTTDDVDISNAFRMICSLPHKHEDKLEVVALLLRYNRAVEMANVEPNLIHASILGTNYDISTLLLDNGFNRPCEKQFEHLIRQLLKNDFAEGLCHLLNRFPNIAPLIRNGQLLCDAIDAGSEECAELLINEGVSIYSRNKDGSSLLFAACMMGDTHTAELLLENGADPDECTQDGDPLTTIAALDEDRDMVRLLLDYGASIHSSPPGRLTRHPNMGFLDIAISFGLIDAVDEIVDHKNFGSPTDEEISRHWQTVINTPCSAARQGIMIDILLGSKRFDKDQIFMMTDDEPGSVVEITPLHLCVVVGLFMNRIGIIQELVNSGADIHKRLPVRPNTQTQGLEPESKLKGVVGFEGKTPLGWAIEFSSIRVVRALLKEKALLYNQFLGLEMEETRMDLMLHYAKAACRRQKPVMFSLLFKNGLDRTIYDEDGNTIIHMICDYVETFWPNNEPEWTMECIAERAAFSLITCLKWAVMYELRNKKGVSGMDRVLQILKYSGNCEFRQTLAKHWLAALDDSDEEEDPDDEESGDNSDDEPSDGGLDPDNEISEDESLRGGSELQHSRDHS